MWFFVVRVWQIRKWMISESLPFWTNEFGGSCWITVMCSFELPILPRSSPCLMGCSHRAAWWLQESPFAWWQHRRRNWMAGALERWTTCCCGHDLLRPAGRGSCRGCKSWRCYSWPAWPIKLAGAPRERLLQLASPGSFRTIGLKLWWFINQIYLILFG